MSALVLDVAIEQGATWQREFTATSEGVAFPLDGFTLSGDLMNATGVVVASFALSATGNKVLAELTDEQTALLVPATMLTHSYFVKAVSPGGVGYRIAKGRALISSEK